MGNPTVKVNDKPLLTESHESEQSAQEIFSQESGEQDDQYSVNSSKSRSKSDLSTSYLSHIVLISS